jgi:RNA polymerase sigma-70 factor, ECF subfamily
VSSDPSVDNALATAAKAGDRVALERLLHAHADRIHAVCRRIVGDPDDALDATQEAMIAVARGITRFDGSARISTWIYRVATNAALDEARRRNRRPVPAETLPERAGAGAERVDESVADRLDIDAALSTLSPEYRAAVALRDLVGMDYAEIAEVLELAPGTVRSRISRGRAALADALGNRETTSEHPTSGTP